jgi:hypothetical protein
MTANYDEPIPPLLVKVVPDESQQKRPVELRTSHRTFVLSATNPYMQVTGYDPALMEIYMNVFDNPIVICRSIASASDLNNTTGAMAAPNGRLMAVGPDYKIPGPDEMWIATNTYPTRVAVTLVRCI